MDETARLLKIKEQIKAGGTSLSEIKGKISSVKEQIYSGFKIDNFVNAKKKLEEIRGSLDQMEDQFKTEMQELEAAYPWE